MYESIQYNLFPWSAHLRHQICTSSQDSASHDQFSLFARTHANFFIFRKITYAKYLLKSHTNFGEQESILERELQQNKGLYHYSFMYS